jgi:hypothetical protein
MQHTLTQGAGKRQKCLLHELEKQAIICQNKENGKCDKKWGGTRQGSGAKPKYNEETKTVAFRCPLSKVDELKLVVKSKLSEWSVK